VVFSCFPPPGSEARSALRTEAPRKRPRKRASENGEARFSLFNALPGN